MTGTVFALLAGGLIVAVLVARAFALGRSGARSAAAAEKAADVEKRVSGLSDPDLDAELAKWSRPPR